MATGLMEEKDLNNGSLISQLEVKLPSRINYGSADVSLAAVAIKTGKLSFSLIYVWTGVDQSVWAER